MKAIIVTGSIATGKTTVAKKLAKIKNYKYVDVHKLIEENKLSCGYDKKRKTKIVDVAKLNKFLIKLIENSKEKLIIDSHLSHYLPAKYVSLCFVTKCDIKVLKKRLEKRKYSKEKIRENLDAEILDICLNEALENKQKVKIIYTTKGFDVNKFKFNL